jgi:hypothetical protein
MKITVRLKMAEALAFQRDKASTPVLQEILQTLDELGLTLTPIHPGAADPLLAPYFTVKVRDVDRIEQVIERLRQFSAVEAAYVKPPADLP